MDSIPETTELAGGPAVAIREQHAVTELPAFFSGAFAELMAFAGEAISGPPAARYHRVDRGVVDVEVVFPVRASVPVHGRVKLVQLEAGPAVQVRHIGSYEDLRPTYASIQEWLKSHHAGPAGPPREIYLTGPKDVRSPEEHITLVVQPFAFETPTAQA